MAPVEAGLAQWQANSRLIALLSTGVALLALVLAAIGVYAVVAYAVTRRRRELGIRLALGATARDVQVLLARQTLTPVAIGVAFGVATAAAVSRVLERLLFGISPLDPIAFAGAAARGGVAATGATAPAARITPAIPAVARRLAVNGMQAAFRKGCAAGAAVGGIVGSRCHSRSM